MEHSFEKQSAVDRVIKASPEKETALLKHFEEALRNQKIDPYEKPKNAEEMEIINAVLERIPSFVSAYGGKAVRGLTPENIHLIDVVTLSAKEKEAMLRADAGAACDFETQSAIVIPESDSFLTTAQRIVHELMHLHAFTSFELEKKTSEPPSIITGQGEKLHFRRIGFGIFDATHKKRHFRDLDEAIIEELSARFDTRHFSDISALTPELARRSELRKKVSRDSQEIASVVTKPGEDGRWQTVIQEWRYAEPRAKLRSLIREIYNKHKEEFASEEEVFTVFAKAIMTGRLLDIARLVERTFGKGSFAGLGEETMAESGRGEKA